MKHYLVCRLCARLEMRTPQERIAEVTYGELPLTYEHLNWFFDKCYDYLNTRSILFLAFFYLTGGVPKVKLH